MIETGCICYKVLMRFPHEAARNVSVSSGLERFVLLRILHHHRLLISECFAFPEATSGPLSFVIIGPATALKRQAQSHEDVQKMGLFHGGVINGAGEKRPQHLQEGRG